MKNLRIAVLITALLIVTALIFAGCGKKDKAQTETTENTTVQTVTEQITEETEESTEYSEPAPETTEEPEEYYTPESETAWEDVPEIIENKTVYVKEGELELDGVKYYVSDKKLIAESADGNKTVLSDEKCAEDITICGNEIYYTVIESERTVNSQDGTLTWYDCSCRRMKLDGSGKTKLFDYLGEGRIIHITNKYYYYVDDLERNNYYHYAKMHKGFFRYDRKTGESVEIFTEGGLKYADPVFVGGSFLFCSSDMGFLRYDTSTGDIRKIYDKNGNGLGLPQDTVAYGDNAAYFTAEGYGRSTLYKYDSASGKAEPVCEIDDEWCRIDHLDGDFLVFYPDINNKRFNLKTNTFTEE